jgi:Flp pilus assembly protein TadG
MALVAPMLIALMFGSFELGNYFMSEHAVAKAVRDGARFASRLPVSTYSCPAGGADGSAGGFAPGSTALQNQIKNITRTGSIDGTATPRLSYWTSAQESQSLPTGSPITLTVTCRLASTFTGVFSGMPGNVPVVSVAANVRYPSLLGQMGLSDSNLRLESQSKAPVMGI